MYEWIYVIIQIALYSIAENPIWELCRLSRPLFTALCSHNMDLWSLHHSCLTKRVHCEHLYSMRAHAAGQTLDSVRCAQFLCIMMPRVKPWALYLFILSASEAPGQLKSLGRGVCVLAIGGHRNSRGVRAPHLEGFPPKGSRSPKLFFSAVQRDTLWETLISNRPGKSKWKSVIGRNALNDRKRCIYRGGCATSLWDHCNSLEFLRPWLSTSL